jgi:NADP-dependent 3-hydroxy acid dehydrogenase YdfG
MHFIKTNVAKEEDWEQLMENTLSKWGRVDILVNNAGTSYRNKVNQINPASAQDLNSRKRKIRGEINNGTANSTSD